MATGKRVANPRWFGTRARAVTLLTLRAFAMNLRHRPGQGDPAIDAQRARVLSAARDLLAESRTAGAFSLDTVAARAGVARSIMQQQFGTAAGVLEALWDELLSRGCLGELPRAFQLDDPRATLAEVIAVYGRFWDAERDVVRRLRAHAALDTELDRALRMREHARREGLQRLARRIAQDARLGARHAGEVLCMLTAFETFDGLAGAERRIAEVIPTVEAFARAALGLAPVVPSGVT